MGARISRWLIVLAATGTVLTAGFLLRKPVARHFFERGLEAKRDWRLEPAVESFRWALKLDPSWVDARFESALCNQLRGEFIASRNEIDRVLDEPMDLALRARVLNACGVNHFNSNQPDAAIERHIQSLELAREIGQRRIEAQALIDLSRVLYHLKGQSDKALEHLSQALRIGREIGDELIEADALRNIGVVYWWFKGELDRPLSECYERALEIYRRMGDLRSAAITLCNIALVHSLKGDLFQFLRYQNESVELKHRVGDMAGLCDSYFFLGNFYEGLGNYRKAREYYLQSVEIGRQTGYGLGPKEEDVLASIYTRLGEHDRVIGLLNRVLERERANPFQAKRYLGGLAYCCLLKGDAESARQYFERVLEIERLIGEPDIRSTITTTAMLGEAYMRLGDLQKASEVFSQAEELRKKQRQDDRSLGYSLVMAEFMELQGRRAEALRYLVEAAEMQSERFRSSGTILVPGQSRMLYDRVFTLLLDRGGNGAEVELAFRFLEQLRYSSFRNLVLQLSEKKSNPRPAAEEKEALSRIERAFNSFKSEGNAETRNQLRRAYGDYEDLTLKSVLNYPRYKLIRDAQPAELEAAQSALSPDTALVEYLFGGEKVFALVITRSSYASVALPVTRTNLASKVKLFRSLIFNRSQEEAQRADWKPVAEDLRRSLIEPIERTGSLAGVRRLGLVPFGSLHDLPFAALARAAGEGVRFLVEDYSIFRTPSATYLANLSHQPQRQTSRLELGMLGFGRNESDEPELLPLEFAVEEARVVAGMFGGDARGDQEASETELKQLAPHFKYIHLATHAVSEPEMPLLSRLKLQSTREDDGNLTAREILDLGLEAELVTLGACQTGQSYSFTGDELAEVDRIGLIEAFLHAGARTVMASLLPVSDRPTTEFMKGFYKNLRTKEKADALCETQRAMIRGELFFVQEGARRELTHPRYWAPFIVAGDYR